MSLAPSTDLVLEVSRAADPQRAAAVVAKLNALGQQGAGPPKDFETALSATAPPRPTPTVVNAPVAAASRASKAQTKLELVMLSEFIGEMLPKDTPSAYGEGYAGDMWRSMLAERVADQIAASGRLGLASHLFGHQPQSGGGELFAPEKSRGLAQADAAQASANALASPSGADIEQGAVLFARKQTL